MVAARNTRCKPGSGAAHSIFLLNQSDSKISENLEACFLCWKLHLRDFVGKTLKYLSEVQFHDEVNKMMSLLRKFYYVII